MKFKLLNLLISGLVIILSFAFGACAQNNSIGVEYNNTMKEARMFFGDMLNNPERFEQAKSIQLDNELQPNAEGRNADFYFHPLQLDKLPLDYGSFSIKSKGILTLVEGNPESPDAKPIPFHIYVRRNGTVIIKGGSNPNLEVSSVDIETVMAQAKPEDQLVIEPVRKRDWKAKRILRIAPSPGC